MWPVLAYRFIGLYCVVKTVQFWLLTHGVTPLLGCRRRHLLPARLSHYESKTTPRSWRRSSASTLAAERLRRRARAGYDPPHHREHGLALIKPFEGFEPLPYVCPAGYLTEGYGCIVKNPKMFTHTIIGEQASDILASDVQSTEPVVLRLIRVLLTDGQFDTRVSFTFNLDSGALQCSTPRRLANREEPAELQKWVWVAGSDCRAYAAAGG